MAAANAQIGVATAASFQPHLNASGGFASSTLGTLFSLPNRFWSLGPQLLATVFDGGRRRAVVAQSEATYDADVAAYRESVLTAFQNVEDNLRRLRILADEATQQTAATAAAERSLALTRNRYAGRHRHLPGSHHRPERRLRQRAHRRRPPGPPDDREREPHQGVWGGGGASAQTCPSGGAEEQTGRSR